MSNISMIKQEKLRALLKYTDIESHWFKQVSSTNQLLKQHLANTSLTAPQLILSDQQTSGYGTHKRHFISGLGGMYFSLAVNIAGLKTSNIGLLTTGIAWQLHQVIQQIFQIDTQIKWVNDLLLNNKKIAGILVETIAPTTAIIGIGLNLYQPHIDKQLTTSTNLLSENPAATSIYNFIAQLAIQLEQEKDNYLQGAFLTQYKKHLVTLGQQVVVQIGDQQIRGTAVDVDAKGHLLVKTAHGIKTCTAGEIKKYLTK
ncbi:biotin--[acetyl-CoA-carboxylase] ligase [Bombilactobacillus thymidiniphilus]|uniref:biotin--[biotin carboxyl-carrier protein] ligase n=1 Tax=Bombilactobacillus thymidiniphilus TaxID=2923363 RepID=A0ABY4PEY9_9LACO|nr:biotin--[acetyl-CoA-carboxylase] ligase [Bombilactobacillus thymidiniphilus]UQS84233.1 biotin--[acetyl-CoA-carboxylase] ligase [Bombilactobacillus thymidiniphilus]